MNEIFEDDYIDFTEEIQESIFICPTCQWFNGINWCLKDPAHNLDGEGVSTVTMCIDYVCRS
jgi:hypothetical protein